MPKSRGVQYIAMNFWPVDKGFVLELRNMKASMDIVNHMTQTINVSFHLVFGNDDEISTVATFKENLKQQRNDSSRPVLNAFFPNALINMIHAYEF